MIKANISKKNQKQTIEAYGSIPEIASDITVLLSSIYKQFKAVSPNAAEQFRLGVQKMVADDNGPCWTGKGNQTGIAVRLPNKEE